jgi:hypothetical protein
MNASAVNTVIERSSPTLTLGDLVAAVSEVAQDDSAQLLGALFASGRVHFVEPDAINRVARLLRPLPSGGSSRAPHAWTRSASRRRASRAS